MIYPKGIQKGDTIGQAIFQKFYTTDDDQAQGQRCGGFGSTNQQGDSMKQEQGLGRIMTIVFLVIILVAIGISVYILQKQYHEETLETAKTEMFPYFFKRMYK